PLPMAKNSSSSSSSSSNKEEKNTPYIPLAELLAERVRINVPFQKIPENYRASWAKDFRLMVEVDKIPIERIREVLDWATTDEFWRVNIRSASTFREKFGTLEAKSRRLSPTETKRAEVDRSMRVGGRGVFKTQRTPEQEAMIPAIKKEYAEKAEIFRQEKGLKSIDDIDPFEFPSEYEFIQRRLGR
ncbi:MAG: hypothetical protein WC530_10495, partial [Candidatus Omnitrophota bacterium]